MSILSRYIKLFSLLLLCPFFCTHAVFAEFEDQVKLYPLPLAEMDEVISQCLEASGFTVKRSCLKKGQVTISAVKAKQDLRIALKQHSVLATDVHFPFATENSPDHIRIEKLERCISRYLNPSLETPDEKIYGSTQKIPNAVLTRLESTVCIKANGENIDVQFSGFIVDKKGLILCTAHDLKDGRDISVIFFDGREMKGRVVKMDLHRDLTLLSVDAELDSVISIAEGRELVGMGERLYSVGCPVNLRGTIFPGLVNGPQRRMNDLVFWQVNMKIHPGSSGGPVFDVLGNLVAVVKGRHRGTDSVGFLIPLWTVIEFINEFLEN